MFLRSLVLVLSVVMPYLLLAQSVSDKCFEDSPDCLATSAQTSFAETLTDPAEDVLRKPESDQISISLARPPKKIEERFHWGPALSQSMEFLAIQHSYRMATSYWGRYEMQGPFFRDWLHTVAGVRFTKW